MSAAIAQDVMWSVHPLKDGGYLLIWPTWAGLPDSVLMEVATSLMGGHPERWTMTAGESPVDNHAAWLIEPI